MSLTVIAVERVPAGLRGDLSRWMLQPQVNVFVGSLSADVRARLWERVAKHRSAGACLMVNVASNEQGFEIRLVGDRERQAIDCEGMALIQVPPRSSEE